MGFLIIIGLLAVSVGFVGATFRHLRRVSAGRIWWAAFTALMIVGFGVGCWFAFRFEYHTSPTVRVASFPVPLAIFQLEDGLWVDFVTPAHVMYPGLFANVATFVAAAVLPLLLVSLVSNRMRKKCATPVA